MVCVFRIIIYTIEGVLDLSNILQKGVTEHILEELEYVNPLRDVHNILRAGMGMCITYGWVFWPKILKTRVLHQQIFRTHGWLWLKFAKIIKGNQHI